MKIADEQRKNAERKSADILDLFQVPLPYLSTPPC